METSVFNKQKFFGPFFQKRTACLLFLLTSAPAKAHAILIDSTPAPLSHIPAGHLNVTLRYNSRIDAARSKLTLKQGDVQNRVQADAASSPDLLHASLDLSAGDYQLLWQVLAIDGHVTRGRVPFTVDAGAGAHK